MKQNSHGAKVEKKVPSALPIYLAAGAFLLCALALAVPSGRARYPADDCSWSARGPDAGLGVVYNNELPIPACRKQEK